MLETDYPVRRIVRITNTVSNTQEKARMLHIFSKAIDTPRAVVIELQYTFPRHAIVVRPFSNGFYFRKRTDSDLFQGGIIGYRVLEHRIWGTVALVQYHRSILDLF